MRYKIKELSFLGKPLQKNTQYVVIGGGIAGLMLGFFLKKNNVKFKLIEQNNTLGGLLKSHHSDFGLAEQAANGFIWCAEMQEICDDLGLKIALPRQISKARYLVRNRQLKKFPLTALETIKMVGKMMLPHPPTETIADFGEQYFGKAFSQQLLEPAFAGIYGADIRNLSFPGALSTLANILNKSSLLPLAMMKMRFNAKKNPNTSKKRQTSGTHGFTNGMSEFVEALANYLKDDIELNVDGRSLKDTKENLIITTPAYVASDFFEGETKNILQKVRYTPIITTTLFFNRSALGQFKDGFGCLIPRNENLQILGVLFNSCIFDHRVKDETIVSLTCIMRDDSENLSLLQQLDLDIKNLLVKELDILFDISEKPLYYHIFRWEKGIPLYSPTLYKSWFELDDLLNTNYPNRNLFGNYTGQISIRGMSQSACKAVSSIGTF